MVARRRWICGGAAARHGHAIASSHRFLRCLSRLCRRVQISQHIDSTARENRCFHAAATTQEAGYEQAEALAGSQAEWTQRQTCGRPSSTQEGELVDALLTALDVAGAFRGRSQGQKLVRQADATKFPRGSHEMQSWRKKSRICKHILTARQQLDNLRPLGSGPRVVGAGQAGTQAGRCSCEPGSERATSNVLETPAAKCSQPG